MLFRKLEGTSDEVYYLYSNNDGYKYYCKGCL